MIYLVFNEGYSANGGEAEARGPLCEEAIGWRGSCCGCFRLSPR